MKNILFKKLRLWEEGEETEAKLEQGFADRNERLRTLRTRLDMLLGAAVTTLVFCVAFLIVHGFKVL